MNNVENEIYHMFVDPMKKRFKIPKDGRVKYTGDEIQFIIPEFLTLPERRYLSSGTLSRKVIMGLRDKHFRKLYDDSFNKIEVLTDKKIVGLEAEYSWDPEILIRKIRLD